MSSARRSRGFTYLGVLFIVSLLAITAAAASVVWATAQQREREVELVFIGRQFTAAIERYRAQSVAPALDAGASPTVNPAALYPRRLDELLRDDRALTPQHHLRRLFVDPMTGQPQWGLIRLPDGGIVGVHSLSERKPYPRTIVLAGFSAPTAATSYRDWRFIAPSAEGLLDAPAPPSDIAALLFPTRTSSALPRH